MNFFKKSAPAASTPAAQPSVDTQAHVEGAPAPAATAPAPSAEAETPDPAPEPPGIEDRIAALEQQNTELAARCATLEDRVTALEATDGEPEGGETEATTNTPAPGAETPTTVPAAEAPAPALEAASPKTRREFLAQYNALTDPLASARFYDEHSALLALQD
jgi:hypothetical protein